MADYHARGFNAATLGKGRRVWLVIQRGIDKAAYSQKTHNVYIPFDRIISQTDTAEGNNLMHELAHWIQDQEYRMSSAAVSGPKTWWVENNAEVMTMLIDPAYLNVNLTYFVKTPNREERLGLQLSPFAWDS